MCNVHVAVGGIVSGKQHKISSQKSQFLFLDEVLYVKHLMSSGPDAIISVFLIDTPPKPKDTRRIPQSRKEVNEFVSALHKGGVLRTSPGTSV